jgi:hypothetical protein
MCQTVTKILASLLHRSSDYHCKMFEVLAPVLGISNPFESERSPQGLTDACCENRHALTTNLTDSTFFLLETSCDMKYVGILVEKGDVCLLSANNLKWMYRHIKNEPNNHSCMLFVFKLFRVNFF